MTLFASARSTITTWFVSFTFSRLRPSALAGNVRAGTSLHADEVVRLQSEGLEGDRTRLDSEGRELRSSQHIIHFPSLMEVDKLTWTCSVN